MNVRFATIDDAAAISAIYRPYVEATHISFEEVPPDAAEMAGRMAHPLYAWLIVTDEERIAGYASTAPLRGRAAYRWSVETGIYLAADCQGKGLGRALLAVHLRLLERQGFVAAIAGISLPNEASVRLHERAGFQPCGVEREVGFKQGRWVDVGRWQRDLAPRRKEPADPLPVAKVPL